MRRLGVVLVVARGRAARRRGGRRHRLRRRRRLTFSRLLLLIAPLIAFHVAQPPDVFLMLLVGLGKSVTAGAVGDKIKFAGTRRIGGGFERGATRIGDWSG